MRGDLKRAGVGQPGLGVVKVVLSVYLEIPLQLGGQQLGCEASGEVSNSIVLLSVDGKVFEFLERRHLGFASKESMCAIDGVFAVVSWERFRSGFRIGWQFGGPKV